MSTPVTLTGRLVADPELRFGNNGDAICNFRVVTSRRYKDAAGEWQDKDTSFWSVTAWRQLGENVAESLSKGDAVLVVGDMRAREWETKEGEKRTVFEVEAKAVGPDLARATAKVSKVTREGGAGRDAFGAARSALADPWATNTVPDSSDVPF